MENPWASRFAEAFRAADDRLVAFEKIPHQQVLASPAADEASATDDAQADPAGVR